MITGKADLERNHIVAINADGVEVARAHVTCDLTRVTRAGLDELARFAVKLREKSGGVSLLVERTHPSLPAQESTT